jgi:hypothetical protein
MRAEAKEVVREWRQLREEYFKAVDARDTEVRCGCLSNEVFWQFEKRSMKKLNKLRRKLMNLLPKQFHFGKVNLVNGNIKSVPRYSSHGDVGYMLCEECHSVFKATDREADIDVNKFWNCSEHEGRVADARYRLLLDDVCLTKGLVHSGV